MARYRYTGEGPVTVPDLKRFADDPLKPGEEFETDIEIHNEFFTLVLAADKPGMAPEEVDS